MVEEARTMIEITPQNDISVIWGNPYMGVVNNWHSYYHQKQLDLIHGMQKLGVPQGDIGLILREPSIEGALRELHREAEYGIAKERREESTFRRLRSVLDADEPDPILSHPELLIQQVIPAARVTSVGAIALQRSIPKLVTATGVAGAFWRDMMSHMKAKQEASKRPTAGGEPSKAGSGSAPRIQNSKVDADNYIKGLTDQKNVLLNRGQTKDGYHYYEVMQKVEYKGITFRRGDFVSRDPKHNEIEWFRGKDVHRGARSY